MMQIGVTFPQTEIGTDPGAIRDYAQAASDLGYSHLVAGEHVLSPGLSYPKEVAPYRATFHEPFALFGFLAALTPLELIPSVIILPQRQTVLVAKQAAEIDVPTGGKLRLGKETSLWALCSSSIFTETRVGSVLLPAYT